jgi:hypothetical protein
MQIFNFNRKSKEAASDFWMADSYAMKTRKRDEDVMELSSYRRAVANFVRIVTGDNIPVKYHTADDSKTDGKTVTISASTKLDERDIMVGLALHEGSHIKLTDFKLVNEVFRISSINNNSWLIKHGLHSRAAKCCKDWGSGQWDQYTFMKNFKDIFNYVEDRRIDNFVMTQAPGYMPYYQALYDKYFNSTIITKGLQSKDFRTEDWESYIFRLMNITNPASDLKALKRLQQIWDVLDLEHIDRLQNSNDGMMLAFNITEIIHDAIAEQKKKEQEQQQQQNSNGDSKDDKKKDNKSQKDTNGDAKDSKSDDKNSKSDDESDPMSSDAEGEDSEGGDSDESGKGSKSKGNDKKEDKKKESSEDESDSEDNSEDQGEGEEDDSEGSGGVGDGEDEESDDQSDEGDDEGDGDGEEEVEKELPELSKADAGRLVKQISEQKQFQDGQVGKKKLSKSTSDVVSAIDDSDIAIADVAVGGGYGASGSSEKVIVVRKFNRKLAETTNCSMWYSSPNRTNTDAVADGIRMGTVLGKKLKVRAEERSTKFNRLRSGKIDKRMISQAGYGAEGIFEKIESFSYRPGIIHMSIDSSGSMSGSKFKRSLTCAAAIAKACSMIENMDCVISFRSTGSIGKNTSDAMVVVAYDSTRQSITDLKTLLPYITANGGTPEGLCFDALMNDILGQAKGKDAYFVNFSDGQPYHGYNYHGLTAVQHTRKQVNKMIASGMKVISYFISESNASASDNDTFRSMYGKDAQFIDVKSINAVAKTMNDKFLEINNA